MGEGNFSGGGSVTWEVTHSDGESCTGHKHGAKGKDKHPKGENGMFVVTVTGHKPIFAPVNGTTVRVIWGEPGEPGATGDLSADTAVASSTTGKAKGKSKSKG